MNLPHETYRWGSALDWALALTVIVCVLILAGIVVARVVYKNRQTEGTVLWVHLLALGIFPLLMLVFGNFAVLEYATQQQFCATCHLTMQPYIDDLHRPNSKSLAARHFQDRFAPGTECYACHADYGIHGTFEAKLAGLRDVYKYYTRTFHLPIKMPRPYQNQLCLKCHDGSRKFLADDSHTGPDGKVSADLVRNETRCTECHKLPHQIQRAVPRPGGTS